MNVFHDFWPQYIRTIVAYTWIALIFTAFSLSGFQKHSSPPQKTPPALLKAEKLVEWEKYEPAIPILEELLTSYLSSGNSELGLQAAKSLELCFYSLQKHNEAIDVFEKSLRYPNLSDTLNATLLNYLADYYYEKGSFTKSIEVYEKGLPIVEKLKINKLCLRYYGSLGYLYWDTGNHLSALEFQKKSLQYALLEKDKKNTSILLRYIGNSYTTMNNKEAINYFHQSLQYSPNTTQTYIQFSKAYQQFNMLDSALIVLQTGLAFIQSEGEKADAYYQYSSLYLGKGEVSQAAAYIKKALHFGLKTYGESHSDFHRFTLLAGKIALAQNNPQQALHWFDQILQHQSQPRIPGKLEVSDLTPGSYWVLGSLNGKGKALMMQYRQTQNAAFLHEALAAFDLGMAYGEKMRLSHSHESSKIELYEYLRPVVQGAIDASLALARVTGEQAYVEKAFLFAERAKAPVMAEGLYDKQIKHIAGIPDSLLALENTLQEQADELEVAHADDPKNDSLDNALLEANLRLTRFKDNLKNTFPRYFELKYAFQKSADLQQIRAGMPDDALALQYMIGDSTIYCFALSKNSLNCFTLAADDSLYQQLKIFRRSVSDWDYYRNASLQAEQDFLQTAPILFDKLLARALAGQSPRRLIVIPDGYLGLIPFEALLMHPYSGPWIGSRIPYLIRDYSVSYAWSAGAIHQEKSDRPSRGFLGVGTQYEDVPEGEIALALRDLGPLPLADDEARAIGRMMHGDVLLNESATKAGFLASAADYGILHIATHGLLDEQHPNLSSLLFQQTPAGEDAHLYALELYGMQLKAYLTVLSACNTGQGEIHEGEGMMSLARAFAFAGCPALVSSLWNVNDRSTSGIMQRFYQQLKKGERIDGALRDAKLNYIHSANSENSKPIYWAGFVAIGNSDALPPELLDTGWPWYMWLAVAIAIVAVLGYGYKRSRAARMPLG